jgi:hypothetical protein
MAEDTLIYQPIESLAFYYCSLLNQELFQLLGCNGPLALDWRAFNAFYLVALF